MSYFSINKKLIFKHPELVLGISVIYLDSIYSEKSQLVSKTGLFQFIFSPLWWQLIVHCLLILFPATNQYYAVWAFYCSRKPQVFLAVSELAAEIYDIKDKVLDHVVQNNFPTRNPKNSHTTLLPLSLSTPTIPKPTFNSQPWVISIHKPTR